MKNDFINTVKPVSASSELSHPLDTTAAPARLPPRTSSSSSTDTTPSCSVEVVSPKFIFGPGTVSRLPTELGQFHLSAPILVSSPSRIALARRIQALIPNLDSRILDSALVNVPTRVVDDVVSRITDRDSVISVGGGSAIGLAKAISIRKGIPHICIPTTYSGSEMSPLLAADGRKLGHRDSKAMPTVIIYDEELTGSTPKRISAPSHVTAVSRSGPKPRRCSRDEDAQWSYIHLPGV